MRFKKSSKIKALGLAGVVLFMSLFGSSQLHNLNYAPQWYEINDKGVPKEIDTPREIEDWISKNIKYRKHGKRCFLPQETLDRRYGDCDDKAILGLALFYKRCNKKGSLIIGEIKINLSSKYKEAHAEPNYAGIKFFTELEFTSIKEYSFDEIPYYPFFGGTDMAGDK